MSCSVSATNLPICYTEDPVPLVKGLDESHGQSESVLIVWIAARSETLYRKSYCVCVSKVRLEGPDG
jgi:hypothetical protein